MVAVSNCPGHGVEGVQLLRPVARELVQHLDRLDASLAVADHRRPHALVLVAPGQKSRDIGRAFVRAERPVVLVGGEYSLLRIAHPYEERAHRLHREVNRVDAAAYQEDSRRRRLGERIPDVCRADLRGVEREDAVLERTVHRHRTEHAAGCCCGDGRRDRNGRAAAADGDQRRKQEGKNGRKKGAKRVHGPDVVWSVPTPSVSAAAILSMSSGV